MESILLKNTISPPLKTTLFTQVVQSALRDALAEYHEAVIKRIKILLPVSTGSQIPFYRYSGMPCGTCRRA